MREFPGATTPWPPLNQLLDPLERFRWVKGEKEGYLFAPCDKHRLAALCFHCAELGIHDSVKISTRRLIAVEQKGSLVRAEAGALARDLPPVKWRFWEPWSSVGSLIARGASSTPPLSVEWVSFEGSVVAQGPGVSCALGELWGGEGQKGIVTSATFAVVTVEPRRWMWRKANPERVAEIQAVASTWSRLDWVVPGNSQEGALLLAELVVSPREEKQLMTRFPVPPESGEVQTLFTHFQRQGLQGMRDDGYLVAGEYRWKDLLTLRSWKFGYG